MICPDGHSCIWTGMGGCTTGVCARLTKRNRRARSRASASDMPDFQPSDFTFDDEEDNDNLLGPDDPDCSEDE